MFTNYNSEGVNFLFKIICTHTKVWPPSACHPQEGIICCLCILWSENIETEPKSSIKENQITLANRSVLVHLNSQNWDKVDLNDNYIAAQ